MLECEAFRKADDGMERDVFFLSNVHDVVDDVDFPFERSKLMILEETNIENRIFFWLM